MLEAAAEHGKVVWVLDRPNPAGRPIEGLTLLPGWESFVGAGADADASWHDDGRTRPLVRRDVLGLDVDYRVIEMEGWAPNERSRLRLAAWASVCGSTRVPNAPNLWMARRLCRYGDAGRARRYRRDVAPRGRWNCLARTGSSTRAMVLEEMRRASRPTGLPDARYATSGSSRPSTSMLAQLCQWRPHSSRSAILPIIGPSRPWRLQAIAFKAIRRLHPTLRVMARLSHTNMNSANLRSM